MSIKKRFAWIFILPFTFCVMAKPVHVAVASNFRAPMQSLVSEFERTTEYRIALSFGSSGKFYAQIKQGAPYQLFFSADQAKPEALQKEKLIIAGSRFTYAIGRLALWSVRAEFTDKIPTQLTQGSFNKLALANPKLAPYGAAAVQVLEHMGLIDITRSKWVIGENIAQTYQFVSTGNAELGFVALSQVVRPINVEKNDNPTYWRVPDTMHLPIKQDVVLLRSGAKSQGALAFLAFMQTQTARDIIAKYGYWTENNQHEEHEI